MAFKAILALALLLPVTSKRHLRRLFELDFAGENSFTNSGSSFSLSSSSSGGSITRSPSDTGSSLLDDFGSLLSGAPPAPPDGTASTPQTEVLSFVAGPDGGTLTTSGPVTVITPASPSPTKTPTKSPTKLPTSSPVGTPTDSPVEATTPAPTKSPVRTPTDSPVEAATPAPTKSPVVVTSPPTATPTYSPVQKETLTLSPVPPTNTESEKLVVIAGPDGIQFETSGPVTIKTPAPDTPSPTKSPATTSGDLDPVTTPDRNFGGFCFSGHGTVQVQGKGQIAMQNLQVGDKVLVSTSGDVYERVYTFGHRQDHVKTEFLQFMPSKLQLSPNHMIFVNNNEKLEAVPAIAVKVGDILSDGQQVTAIQTVVEQTGVYAPYTRSGKIVVNGVMSSNYISLQAGQYKESPSRFLVGSLSWTVPTVTHQWLNHAVVTPHRLWCDWLGMQDKMDTDSGFSIWSLYMYQMGMWYLQLNGLGIGILLIPILMISVLFVVMESLLLHPITGALGLLLALCVHATMKKSNTKTPQGKVPRAATTRTAIQ